MYTNEILLNFIPLTIPFVCNFLLDEDLRAWIETCVKTRAGGSDGDLRGDSDGDLHRDSDEDSNRDLDGDPLLYIFR